MSHSAHHLTTVRIVFLPQHRIEWVQPHIVTPRHHIQHVLLSGAVVVPVTWGRQSEVSLPVTQNRESTPRAQSSVVWIAVGKDGVIVSEGN
ncbi:hypothetical protein JZ751_024635 [Albula glossodonta]|uniref:Uncharacterized protein n=1 Tax=Albula glossodonta TaxID=121402 RepID=A0A8T2PG89_9TELE|nr:hypothetical protein JZ751_024635 [Albula glossodonta]